MKEQAKDVIIDPLIMEWEVKLNFFSCCPFQNLQIRRLLLKMKIHRDKKEKDLLYIRKQQISKGFSNESALSDNNEISYSTLVL